MDLSLMTTNFFANAFGWTSVIPAGVWFLILLLAIILIWFIWVKRPVYEAVGLGFVLLVIISGNFSNIWTYIDGALSTNLLYSMVAFVAMSILLTKTKIVDSCIAIILSVIGRVTGGAGYAAVIASGFMGALSGSGPGNVMATGAITIPAMKRSGFPAELAANIESNASYMGNMIPPSSNIVAAMTAYTTATNLDLSTGQFWMILWGISAYFIIQRLVMVWGFCKYYKVKPIAKEDLPSLRETLKKGWTGLLLPFIILVPFILDAVFKDTFFTKQLGETGAANLSSSVLLFVGGIAALFAVLVTKDKKMVTPNKIATMFSNGIKTFAPAIGVCVFGYMLGELFADLNVGKDMAALVGSWNFGQLGTVLVVCLITCFLGMVIPGSSLVVIFGPVFISILSGAGCSPLLAAAMLPCICGVMCGITPPLGLGMYAGMTLAESDFKKTFNNNLWWVSAQFILQVLVLMGWLPILGL
ncbi:MAG: TRAP transporter large permease subunit [Ruminococcaceae bacterium]|nr:TRAP transporter large permease subunit [Oscillospiraceae bacterium]